MASGDHFPIPAEYLSKLRVRTDPLDSRTDAEILDSLSNPEPVASEKNVWCFWHAGVTKMPGWSQRNVIGWVRKLGPEWTVRVLDKVDGSPFNALNFIPSEYLPETYLEGTMDGPYVGQHSSDMVRTPLLYLYGGVWLDVGIILFMHLDDICWNTLSNPDNPFEVLMVRGANTVLNYWMSARKGSTFMLYFHKVFLELWKGHTNCVGIHKNPLLQAPLALQKHLAKTDPRSIVGMTPDNFNIPVENLIDYAAQMFCWDRVCMVEKEPSDGFSGRDYFEQKVLLVPNVREETFPASIVLGWEGQDFYDALATRIDGPQDEKYQLASKAVWNSLSAAVFQKIYRGHLMVENPSLGTLWDRSDGADKMPGTFAELLRYGSVHFEQTRVFEPERTPRVALTMQNGALELSEDQFTQPVTLSYPPSSEGFGKASPTRESLNERTEVASEA